MFVLLVPTKIILLLFDGFLPYNLTLTRYIHAPVCVNGLLFCNWISQSILPPSLSSVSPIREVQLELILLQFVIPTLLEHGNYRAGLKFVVTAWAKAAAKLWYKHTLHDLCIFLLSLSAVVLPVGCSLTCWTDLRLGYVSSHSK